MQGRCEGWKPEVDGSKNCGLFRLVFAYTEAMRVTGHESSPDWPKLGPSVLIATALIVAIRTAKWPTVAGSDDRTVSDVDPELDKEVSFATRISIRVMRELLKKHETLFPQKLEPRWEPTDENVPK